MRIGCSFLGGGASGVFLGMGGDGSVRDGTGLGAARFDGVGSLGQNRSGTFQASRFLGEAIDRQRKVGAGPFRAARFRMPAEGKSAADQVSVSRCCLIPHAGGRKSAADRVSVSPRCPILGRRRYGVPSVTREPAEAACDSPADHQPNSAAHCDSPFRSRSVNLFRLHSLYRIRGAGTNLFLPCF